MPTSAVIVTTFAALVSFILGWFLSKQISQRLQFQLENKLRQQSEKIEDLNHLQSEYESLHKQFQQQQVKSGRLEAMLLSEKNRLADNTQALQESRERQEREQQLKNKAEVRVRELETRLEEQKENNKKHIIRMHENKELMKQEFSNLANDIFEAKGKVITEQNTERLETLLKPFKEQLGDFRNKVEEAHKQDNVGRAALKQQLENLHQLNQKMTDEAGNLAKALKGDKKLQGNWGEMQVEKILDSSGLIKGEEYDRESNFKDEYGQNKRPDFIVYLPEGKHLIIDSKVSLVDYMAYVNAEDEQERKAAIARHIQSIRNHINGLNEKDYPGLPEIKAPDFVFMFMPVEPAFIAAFQYDPQLFNDAFEKRIVVVTPTTLLATLRTVANLWTIERQNANARKLADKARQVYDKLRVFVEKMEKLDIQLSTARSTYDEAMGSLKHGRGNLISQASRFLELGVRVKKELPGKTMETADLEPLPEQK